MLYEPVCVYVCTRTLRLYNTVLLPGTCTGDSNVFETVISGKTSITYFRFFVTCIEQNYVMLARKMHFSN